MRRAFVVPALYILALGLALAVAGWNRGPGSPGPRAGSRYEGGPPSEPTAPLLPTDRVLTCALIDPEKDPRIAVVEARLLAAGGAVWVERASVDAVLAEQKLQAMFNPEGVGERVRLGKLLKADLLVLVRPARGVTEAALEVVVSETVCGLRLAVRGVRVTDDAAVDAAGIAAVIGDGIRKGRVPLRQVVAVPPFVSQDLTFEFDHLKAVYAKVVEGAAVARPGVLAVELAEADALARELALTATEGTMSRPLPLYLLGEYRHEDTGADRVVTMKLRAERGGKPVGRPGGVATRPDQATTALREWARATLDELAGAVPAATDARAEASQLAARAAEFERLGNWAESLALRESAILLDPDNFEYRVAILLPLARLMDQINDRQFRSRVNGRKPPRPEVTTEFRGLMRRGLKHAEAIHTLEHEYEDRPNGIRGFIKEEHQFLTALIKFASAAGQPSDEELAMRLEAATTLVRILSRTTRLRIFRSAIYHRAAFTRLPVETVDALNEQLIIQSQTHPDAKVLLPWYIDQAVRGATRKASEEYVRYCTLLDRLSASGNTLLKTAAAEARTRLDERVAAAEARSRLVEEKLRLADGQGVRPGSRPSPKRVPAGLPVQPLELVRESDGQPVEPLDGILSAGPRVDVLWGWKSRSLYVMKEKGKVRPVWTNPTGAAIFLDVQFDGRYVWAVYAPRGEWPIVLILDPQSEKVHQLTVDNGLPRGTEEMQWYPIKIAPLNPGRVCAIGSFGRTWVAIVTFDPTAGTPAVKVLHEAREAQGLNKIDQLEKTTVGFQPAFAFCISGRPGADGRVERRVLIGRDDPIRGSGSGNLELRGRPLVIDPDRGTVGVMKAFKGRITALPNWFAAFAATDSAVFAVEILIPHGKPPALTLYRLGLPDLEWVRLGPAVADPHSYTASTLSTLPGPIATAIYQGRLHLILQASPVHQGNLNIEWWSIGLDGTGARREGPDVINMLGAALFVSSHYGLIPRGSLSRKFDIKLHTIQLSEQGEK